MLDPYLQFSSPEDEEAYRKREQERKAEIDRALALHTPEGDRRAQQIMAAQLVDAKAHGADKAPEFDDLWNKTTEAGQALEKPASPDLPKEKSQPAPSNDVADIAATLRSAGLSAPQSLDAGDGHGLGHDKLATARRANEGRS